VAISIKFFNKNFTYEATMEALNIGTTIRGVRLQKGMSQGDIEQIRRYAANLNESDRRLLLAMVKKFAGAEKN
jgi:hypothetical protein